MPSIDASERKIIPEFLEAMREEGFPPQFIYAYKKTGYILLSDPEQNLSRRSRRDVARGDQGVFHA